MLTDDEERRRERLRNLGRVLSNQDRIERLEAENAALWEIAQAVANECTVAMYPAINGMSFSEDKHEPWCAACLCVQIDGKEIHDDNCPVTIARALIAKE